MGLGRLRALLPAWRFFDRAVGSPQLWIRYGEPLGAWTAMEILAPCSRRSTRWAFAAADNLALAYQAAVEQLVIELGELDLEDGDDGVERGLVSYELVSRIARTLARGATWQWKIVVPDGSDYLISPIFDSEAG